MFVHWKEQEQKQYNNMTQRFCDSLLDKNEEGSIKALEYLKKRQIDEALIRKFKIGFFPENRKTCLKEKQNLAGRIIFPIISEFGDTIAFSGRLPCEKDETPEDVPHWFHDSYVKSFFVYGLDATWQHILYNQSVIIVEGQIDLISCFRHGLKNTVAVMGTALTDQCITKLLRYANKFYLLFDGDDGGKKAAERAKESLLNFDISPKNIINIPLVLKGEAYDPDEFLTEFGGAYLKKIIELKEKNNEKQELP